MTARGRAWRKPAAKRPWLEPLARLGYVARGVVYLDLGDALAVLETQWAGPWIIGAVGAGCIACGLYRFAKARYRRIRVTRGPDALSDAA